MTTKSQPGTVSITPNKNINFPIGTILAVEKWYRELNLKNVFSKHKERGRDINALIRAFLCYKMTENCSVSRGSLWINRDEVLLKFNLESFEERTLYRVLEIVGDNYEEIMSNIQDSIFERFDFEHTDVNIDWTNAVFWGKKCNYAKYGHSKAHRPDKMQINIGLCELSSPINIPIGMTVQKGNVNDVTHFEKSYKQIRERLLPGSRVVVDKGADSQKNIDLIRADKMKYLTGKKLNKSDDKRIADFEISKAELIDPDDGVYGIKYTKPSGYNYFYFSKKRQLLQLETKKRQALKKLEEAKAIQKSIDNSKKLPKRFKINNELVNIHYVYQTKLTELSEEEAFRVVKSAQINGREGFFCLKSNEDLTLEEALYTYRRKDSIEKMIHSLKNEIEIKPLRVRADNSVLGALIIGFIAQLIISSIRFVHKELKNTSTKFIKISLSNLTVTVENRKRGRKRHILANFDPINMVILAVNEGVT